MRTITLSESVLGDHKYQSSVPSLFPNPQKPLLACYLLSMQSGPKIHTNSKLFLPNPCSNFPRHSKQWILNACEERFGRLLQTSDAANDNEYSRYAECKNCDKITDLMQITCYNVAPHKALLKKSEMKSDKSVGSLLKIMLIFGCLTLQGSQSAFASTDISNGLLSLPYFQDLGDISTGFASAFLLIFFSELGDKTFFIAALLAARNSSAVVFVGTFGALAAMTVISVVLGRTFHYVDEILPFSFGGNDLPLDDIAAVLLLVYFGVTTLLDASSSDGLKAEDEQKEAELAVSEFSGNGAGIVATAGTVISTFFLVFVAEWGDKSFFSTIALAAASSPLGVIAGALAGHGVATLLAVLGGSLLGSFLSEKAIAYIGGVLFLVFAGITLVEIVN